LTVSGLTGIGNGTLGNDTTSLCLTPVAATSPSRFLPRPSLGRWYWRLFMAAQASSANATAVVTYTYSAAAGVPEPTTITLLGLGLLGFGLMSRRIQKQKQ